MKVLFSNIDWDTDGEDVGDLPEKITLNVNDSADLDEDGADILSDEYGFCVNSFEYKILK